MLALCGCATEPGQQSPGFIAPEIAEAYIPLRATTFLVNVHFAAGVAIAPGVAVTNAHNANLIDPGAVIGSVSGYDLMFFRSDHTAVITTTMPQTDQEVVAYGEGGDGGVRMSRGVVRQIWPAAFGFDSDAGPGFSGGPVIELRTGALLGITYGFVDKNGQRQMLAYSIDFVLGELEKIQASAKAR